MSDTTNESRIVVHGLSEDVHQGDIIHAFKRAGKIVNVIIKQSDRYRGSQIFFAIVEFEHASDATWACQHLDDVFINKFRVQVQLYDERKRKRFSDQSVSNQLMVENSEMMLIMMKHLQHGIEGLTSITFTTWY